MTGGSGGVAMTDKSLYVSRRLLNGDDIRVWAKEQGFKSTLPKRHLHVTVLYSKKPMNWTRVPSDETKITVNGGKRDIKRFGDDGEAIVLTFSSEELSKRNSEFLAAGGSMDYDSYRGHITITYKDSEIDVDKVKPYTGELVFGPEVYREIKESFEPEDDWEDLL